MRHVNILLIFLVTLISTTLLTGQYDVNFKYGIHNSSVVTQGAFDGIDDIKTPVTSHFIEATVGKDISSRINVSTGLSYKRKGFGLEYTLEEKILGVTVPIGVRTELDVKAISIPIKVKYRLPLEKFEPYIFSGGGYTFHINPMVRTSANIIGEIDIANIPTNNIVNNGEAFGHVGLGLSTKAGKGNFFGEISYEHSFQNYTSDLVLDVPIRNRGITVGIGYSMPF